MTRRLQLLGILSILIMPAARGIILYGTGDASANTTPPVGILADSGWNTQTESIPSATVIGPSHLLSAVHIGTVPGNTIQFDGIHYTVIRTADAPFSDLRILEIAGRFPSDRIASIYRGSAEVGRPAVLFGCGWGRGEPVFLDGPSGNSLRGWKWQSPSGHLRWGTNVITKTINGSAVGSFIYGLFSSDAGGDEATVALGDSGGGVFILDADGRWKLAGVIYDTDGYFKFSREGPTFLAAIFDQRGLFVPNGLGGWVFVPNSGPERGSSWMATRVSVYGDWIEGQLAVPPPVTLPQLLSSESPEGPFDDHLGYAVDSSKNEISFRASEHHRFFRMDDGRQINSIRFSDGVVTLKY